MLKGLHERGVGKTLRARNDGELQANTIIQTAQGGKDTPTNSQQWVNTHKNEPAQDRQNLSLETGEWA